MDHITELTTKDVLDKVLQEATTPVLVDFWAPWCGPCKMITPVVHELAEEYAGKVTVCKINVDEGGALAEEMDVMGVPTLIFFQNGKEVRRIVGHRPDELREAFATLAK